MSMIDQRAMRHIELCLAELVAEIDDQLARSEHGLALAQLDEREAQGEPVTVVCPRLLRTRIEREIDQHRLTRAKRKLAEVERLLSTADDGSACPQEGTGSADPASASAAKVADLGAYREAVSKAPVRRMPRVRRAGHLIAAAGFVVAVALASLHALRLDWVAGTAASWAEADLRPGPRLIVADDQSAP